MKIWVVIPAFNEGKNIVKVLRAVKNKGLPVMVIEDGSSDDTYRQVSQEKVDVLIQNKTNLGKGASLRIAFAYIKEHNLDCEAVIIMDADAQHLPEELDIFINKLDQGSFFVVGNRLDNPKNMPLIRVITNKLMSFIISRIAGQKIPDTQCGFKAMRTQVLEKAPITTSKYEIDSELILGAASLGYKIDSVPVRSVYRKQRSGINPLLDTARFFKFILMIK